MTKLVFGPCCRPSDYGLGVSDEQTDQVELLRPPSAADFQGLPDAPTLHRLRQVSGLHVTDDTDPARIATNTGRSAFALVACCNKTMQQRHQLADRPSAKTHCHHELPQFHNCELLRPGQSTLKATYLVGRRLCGPKGCPANPSTSSRASAESLPSLCKDALRDQWS